MNQTKEKPVHLSLKITQRTKQDLEDLTRRSNATSLTETIRRSISLLDILTQAEEAGGEFLIRDKDGAEQRLRLV